MYDALTALYGFACPVHGTATVRLHDFRRLERLAGAAHPAVYRVEFTTSTRYTLAAHRHAGGPELAVVVLSAEYGVCRGEEAIPAHPVEGDVVEYVRVSRTTKHKRYGKPLSAKFVCLHLNVLYAICRAAMVEELVQANPVAGIPRPKVQKRKWRILEPHEVPRVAVALDDDLARRIFLTVMLTGLRRFELLGLRWSDVDLLDARLRVRESKTEEGERSVAIPAMLAGELRDHFAASPYRADADYVFGHPTKGSRLDPEWYAKRLRSALTEVGITDYVRPFHDGRHTALTNMAASGASPNAIMATAGHRSMATTNQYIHLAGVVFRDEAAALEARLMGSAVQGSGTKSAEPQAQSQVG